MTSFVGGQIEDGSGNTTFAGRARDNDVRVDHNADHAAGWLLLSLALRTAATSRSISRIVRAFVLLRLASRRLARI